jgi:polysaccharide deacetylase 2 family uncharacterized protein YibQ
VALANGDDKRRRTTPGRRPPPRYRPNPVRMAVYAFTVLAAIMAAYAIAVWLTADKPRPLRSGAVAGRDVGEPWYQSRPAAPGLVSVPSAAIFPEAANGAPPRPYEEALPADVYEHPPVARPAGRTAPTASIPMPPPPAPIEAPPPAAAPPAPDKPPAEPPVAAIAAPFPPPAVIAAPPNWRRHAVPAPSPDGRPRIAIVIDDMGVDRRRSAQAVALPGPLTLSFLTYAGELSRQTTAARAAGHELMVHVSMEPSGADLDPGPNVLLSKLPREELRRRLEWGLGRFEGYVGVNNHMGSRFTADPAGMAVVMEVLRERGLIFLDSRTTGATVGPRLAHEAGVPLAQRNVFLDNTNEPGAVRAQLAELERIARRHGFAVAIGHPRDATIQVLAEWLPTLNAKGLVLVPLSALIEGGRETG